MQSGARRIFPAKLVVGEVRQQREDPERAAEFQDSQRSSSSSVQPKSEVMRPSSGFVIPDEPLYLLFSANQAPPESSPRRSDPSIMTSAPDFIERFSYRAKCKIDLIPLTVSTGASRTTWSAFSVQLTITPPAKVAATNRCASDASRNSIPTNMPSPRTAAISGARISVKRRTISLPIVAARS